MKAAFGAPTPTCSSGCKARSKASPRDAALTNLTELLDTIESLNLTDNKLIQKVCKEIRETMEGVEATELREKSRKFDPDKYNKVRDKMESLKDQFSGYFGEPEPKAA